MLDQRQSLFLRKYDKCQNIRLALRSSLILLLIVYRPIVYKPINEFKFEKKNILHSPKRVKTLHTFTLEITKNHYLVSSSIFRSASVLPAGRGVTLNGNNGFVGRPFSIKYIQEFMKKSSRYYEYIYECLTFIRIVA